MDVLQGLTTARHSNKAESVLTQLLDGTTVDEDGSILMAVWKGLDADYTAAKGYRWASAKTQQRQDRHLAEYRKWMTPLLAQSNPEIQLGKEVAPEANDRFLFPSSDDNRICDLVSKYLILAAGSLRSRSSGTRPTIKPLIGRRFSLLFWVNRLCNTPPPRYILMNGTNGAMYYALEKWNLQSSRLPKVYFGKNELVHLLDFDMSTTTAVEVAEVHHLSWTLAWVCGVRPSSLGRGELNPERFMKFRDISITRTYDCEGKFQGGFVCKTTFTYVKQKKTLDKNQIKSAVFPIFTPNDPQNIHLSPVYRLLVILLRRGYLEHYTSVDELLRGKHHSIKIKETALDLPIFIRSTPGGRQLDLAGIAATAKSFTDYMEKRTHQTGYPEGSTMYAWRREAGTNISRHATIDKTRQFMSHKPGSSTFQLWYENEVFDLDVFAIASGEKQTTGIFNDTNSAAMLRADIVNQALQRKAVVDAWVEDQPSIQELRQDPSIDGRRRLKVELQRLRRLGSRAVIKQARQEQEANRTMEDFTARARELKNPSKIFLLISERAKEATQTDAQGFENEEENDEEDEINDVNRFRDLEDDVNDVEYAHQETKLRGSPGKAKALESSDTIEMASVGEGEDADTLIPIIGLVQSFMEYMLEKRLAPNEPRACQLCQADVYVTPEHKAKLWKNAAMLQRHVDGTFHNGYSTWSRKMYHIHVDGEMWRCPYGCDRQYKTMEALTKHIKKPWTGERRNITTLHDDKKREDGWYREDWESNDVPLEKRQARKRYSDSRYDEETGHVRLPDHDYLEQGEYEEFEQPTLRMLGSGVVEYGSRREDSLESLNAELNAVLPKEDRSLKDELAARCAMREEAMKNMKDAKAARM
ncbi:uncharacterized protein BP5553_10704 [Venustampulla echinocandica]|uniref:C2H2-type domain-containing protein n=1 Tax=Venustampulla echinocandica TaxID=2656787 RepID=A0A370T8J4_9HELO|nr:uncharacterized protein BP5553_10704 [Venustampulla echinocandica]RDL29637.1 hypothetical protein BP5553_10704 [Venustampulla echinocandica]